jgi:hypothetical protein
VPAVPSSDGSELPERRRGPCESSIDGSPDVLLGLGIVCGTDDLSPLSSVANCGALAPTGTRTGMWWLNEVLPIIPTIAGTAAAHTAAAPATRRRAARIMAMSNAYGDYGWAASWVQPASGDPGR